MKKLFTLLLALVMCLASLPAIGCGGGSKDPEDTLVIDIQIGGYGTQWLTDIKDAYVQKTGKKVIITPLGSTTESEAALLAGRTSTDIYFTMDPLFGHQYTSKMLNGTTYDCLLEDLTDFITNDKIANENVSIAEKINPQYLEFFKIKRLDGTTKVYTLPWSVGLLGIAKNNDVWQQGWEVPNTTDKFIELLDTIKGSGYVPLVYSKDYNYYNYLLETFVAQYEGVENMAQLWDAKLPKDDPDYEDEIDKTFLAYYEGVQYAYEVMAELMQSEKVNNQVVSKYHYGINSKDHIGTQTYFLNNDYKIAMMMTGDWIENEMKETYPNPNLEFIKTPVISALGDKLGITDDQLSEIIDYVDGKVSQQPSFASTKGFSSQQVIAKVSEARNLVSTNSNSMAFYIPVYSNAKELAKDFIKFMLSDEGLAIYQNSLGYALPYDYDWTSTTNAQKMSAFINKAYEDFYYGKTIYPTEREKSLIFAKSNLRLYDNHDKQFVVEFAKLSDKTIAEVAEDYFMADYSEVSRKWNQFKSAAGIR